MIADLIVDFDTHIKQGRVYLVEVELEIPDAPDDVPSSITADVYVIATHHTLATYIVSQMYPDALSLSCSTESIGEYEYAARRNRSIL